MVFATETLAAGVNMPARATVISTLSKKLGKTVVKLMPSQLLQMAGRAGRRGKDTQGHVVLMRSRSEDALDAFDLLCAPVDAIRSHFRSSYAMVVNILRTRDLASCRVLVERSFGNYLKAFGLGREQEEDEARLGELKGRLGGVDPGELRMYEEMQEKLAKVRCVGFGFAGGGFGVGFGGDARAINHGRDTNHQHKPNPTQTQPTRRSARSGTCGGSRPSWRRST